MTDMNKVLAKELEDRLARYEEVVKELERQNDLIRNYKDYHDMIDLAPDRISRMQELECERKFLIDSIQDLKRIILGLN